MAGSKRNGQCTYVPEVNGEPSEMFTGLIDIHVERPLVNYIYAKYKASNAAQQMDQAGYARNSQGEHSAADVYKFFKVNDIQRYHGFSIERIENKYGIVTNTGDRTSYSGIDAYRKAQQINQSEPGYRAKVVKRGDIFTVVANKLDSRTQIWESEVDGALTQYQAVKNAFVGTNVDFDALQAEFPELVNPMDIGSLITYVKSLRNADINSLTEKDIKLLLFTGKGAPKLNALLQRGWGTPDEIASKAYEALHNTSGTVSASTTAFVKLALTDARNANNTAFDTALSNMQSALQQYKNSSEAEAIEGILQNLDNLYQINHTIIVRTDKNIKTLTDAAAEAILTLQRQLRYLQKQEGRVGTGLQVEKTLDELAKELAGKRYYIGLLQFLQDANKNAVKISNMLRNVPTTGTAMEQAFAMGRALAKAVTFRDGYNVIIQALRNPEYLLIDENMSNSELDALKSVASTIGAMMDRQKQDIIALQQDLTLTLSQEILGSDTVNGIPLAQIVQMGTADSSIMDFLYSCERVSDPIVASMGTVIRDAQRKRDRIASEFAARIEMDNRTFRDADKAAGKKRGERGDTSRMYQETSEWKVDWDSYTKELENEKARLRSSGVRGVDFSNAIHDWWIDNTVETENGKRIPNENYRVEKTKYYILSNYDWSAFNEDKLKMEAGLRKAGIKGFEFNDAMEQWMHDHTVEVVVDTKNGRTERVPNSNYWFYKSDQEFKNSLDPAFREYYETMMQIKGEIGSLLPSYAQKQFLPPQRRASWLDIVTEGKKRGLDAKGIAKNILHRMNFLAQKEDDTSFVEGGIIGDKEAVQSYSSYDDTILKQVPIYYINSLRDQSDLMFDFSAAVEGLGAVAANYAVLNGCMERNAGANDGITGVREIVENMADYLKERPIAHYGSDGKRRFDLAKWKEVIVGKVIRRNSERTLTTFIVDGFVNKHIYNQQLALGSEGSVLRKLQLLVRGLLGYTSVAALSVNVKGAVSNYLVGEYQMLFESLSGSMRGGFRKKNKERAEFYTFADYARADGIMLGQGLKPGTIMDHLANTTGTLGHLLERRFDPLQDVYNDLGEKRYYSGIKKLIGGFNWMGMYSAGESLIHLHNMYAVLCHEKVLLNGKQVSLFDVFDRDIAPDGKNATLIIKQGATKLDGTAIDDAYLEKVQAKIRLINQKTHGSMNSEDKGIIHQAMVGRALMQFKQWMVEHYSRRFRLRHFDGTTRTWQEGYYISAVRNARDYAKYIHEGMKYREPGYYETVFGMMKNWSKDLLKMNAEAVARWNQLDITQKNNVTRAISELIGIAALLMVNNALGDPKEHKGEGFYRFLIYQIRRLIMDESASVPPIPAVTGGVVKEGVTLAQTPFAITKTLNGLLYPITGIGEITEKYQKGRNQDKNKYWTKIKKNTLPFYGQIDQLLHMDNEDYIFNVFDNIAYNKGK